MQKLLNQIEQAKNNFHADLMKIEAQGGLTEEAYVRYLSFQYHLTKGVQRHFLTIAAHPTMSGRRRFRDFLFRFGLEEEPHFDIARHDLESMGREPLACPLDVRLWWSYFDNVIETRPFVRLGATCVLENLGAGAGDLGHQLLDNADFLTKKNTRFLQIHFHEELPHGDQIIEAMQDAKPTESELEDLIEGAKTGAIIYLRLARWAFGIEELTEEFSLVDDPMVTA